MAEKADFGVLAEPAEAVPAPTAEAPFRIAILGDFRGRGQSGAEPSFDEISTRKSYKVTRANLDDIITLLKVQVKVPDLQGEAFEHSFSALDDFHPDQIHEKADRFAFVSDDDDKATLMAALLHHPNFQALESVWLGVDWFLKRAQKAGPKVEVVLYDLSRAEFVAALNGENDLASSPLFHLLVEKATQGPKGEPWSLWIGLYSFAMNAADVQVLGRMAKLARHAAAPFLAGADSAILAADFAPSEDSSAAWSALRHLPESALVGLTLPRFLLRPPYGENTQSVERFSFEEFTKFEGKQNYLWGNGALAAASLLAQSFLKDGWAFQSGSVLDLEGMPLHTYTQDDEEEVTLAETWLMKPMVEKAVKHGLMPLLPVKGKNAMQMFRFCSLAQPPKDQPAAAFLGRWGQAGMIPLPRSAAKPGFGVGVQFQGTPAATKPAPVSAGVLPGTAAPMAAATPTPAAAPAMDEAPAADALDPELAALMAQFDAPAVTPAPAAADSAPEGALDPELAALMAQFDAPASEPAPAGDAPPDDALDPELAALMAQMDAPPEPAAPESPAEEPLDPELAALMKQMEEGT